MIEHVALFKLKPGVDADKIEWMTRQTRIQLLKIPCVLGLRCGHRLDSGAEWAFFLTVELESEEKLRAFLNAPQRTRFADKVLVPNTTEKLELNFQTEPGGDPLLA